MINHEPWAPGELVLEPTSAAHCRVMQQIGNVAMQVFEAKAADIANDAIKRAIGYTEPAPNQCPKCRSMMNDFRTSEFLGWHGVCVECFMKEDEL